MEQATNKRKLQEKLHLHYKLRCEIAMSMEVGAMALSAFEAKFVENVVEAMVKAKRTGCY